jgi:hypothetical protein
MKKILTSLSVITVLMSLGAYPALAVRNVFRVSWHGTAYSTDANGRVVARPYTQRDILNHYIAATGADPKSVLVAYVWDDEEPAEELEIVSATDGSSIANVFQFLGGLAVSGTDGTQTRRQRFLYDEDHGSALGNVSGAERLRRNAAGEITSFSYQGRFEFSLPEANTVYIGSFATGKRIGSPSGIH